MMCMVLVAVVPPTPLKLNLQSSASHNLLPNHPRMVWSLPPCRGEGYLGPHLPPIPGFVLYIESNLENVMCYFSAQFPNSLFISQMI